MANIKSQIKRIGTNKKAQERNKAVKSELKTAIRATHTAIATGDKKKADAEPRPRGDSVTSDQGYKSCLASNAV